MFSNGIFFEIKNYQIASLTATLINVFFYLMLYILLCYNNQTCFSQEVNSVKIYIPQDFFFLLSYLGLIQILLMRELMKNSGKAWKLLNSRKLFVTQTMDWVRYSRFIIKIFQQEVNITIKKLFSNTFMTAPFFTMLSLF